MENEDLEFSLEDILNEFRDPAEAPEPREESIPEAPVPAEAPIAQEPEETLPMPEASAPEATPSAESEEISQWIEDLPAQTEEVLAEIAEEAEEAPVPADDTVSFEIPEEAEKPEIPVSEDETLRLEDLSQIEDIPAEPAQQEQPTPPPIPLQGRSRLLELKRKLIAGPEKRFYDLSEIGVGKLQIGILLNLLVLVLCIAAAVMFNMGMVPENRLRFLIFSQVLAMLVSALLGSQEMLDGLADLLKLRFSVSTLLSVSFLACCADAWFCLTELRVPCCVVFVLDMTFALLARYHRRSLEMSQMDTLRKAVQLHSVVKEPDYYNGKPGIVRGLGDVEDFMDTYRQSVGPEKVQCVYAFVSMILCFGIAAVAGLRHGPSLAVLVLSTSLLAAVPASFFISFTRPAALLERRLHLVGSVICGWNGVKSLCGKAAFPIQSTDLFPNGSTKLNGVKFYSDRPPEQTLSYATSLIVESGSALAPVFQNLLANRGGAEYPVSEFVDYGNGGIGGMIAENAVLLGSLSFMQDMEVEIPQGTTVSQAVYVAVNGKLCAVVAISYAKMRSASAGLVSLCGFRKVTPIMTDHDFMLTEEFIHSKFSVNTRRMVFPDRETRDALAQKTANPDAPVLALATRSDLASTVYTVSGAAALRAACRWGLVIHMIGGILGMLIMLALGYQGSTELLTPVNVLLYQLLWLIPGILVTEWTRTV